MTLTGLLLEEGCASIGLVSCCITRVRLAANFHIVNGRSILAFGAIKQRRFTAFRRLDKKLVISPGFFVDFLLKLHLLQIGVLDAVFLRDFAHLRQRTLL